MDPFITPIVARTLISATFNLFTSSKNQWQNAEIARNNIAYQQRQQEMQLIQIKLNCLQQVENRAFQAELARLNREQQVELETFRQQMQLEINERNLQFQAWKLAQEQTLQHRLAEYGRETQQLIASYQRETARQQPEVNKLYETWPLRIVPLQILNDQPGHGNAALKVIIAPPEVDYDKFGASNTGLPKLEKNLAESLRHFFGQYYPTSNPDHPVEFLDGAWDSKRFHGGASIKALFAMLSSEPILVLESEIDGDYLNIRFAYWAAGQTRYTYEPVISKFRYRDLVYKSTTERARKWKTAHDLLIQQGRDPASMNELDTFNLKVLEEDEQLAQFMDISELQPRYKPRTDDFEPLNQFLLSQHCLIAGLITDVHHLLQHEASPQLCQWLPTLVKNGVAAETVSPILEAYQQVLQQIANERPLWATEITLDLANGLTALDNKQWAYAMLNSALIYWLNGHGLASSSNLTTNLVTYQNNLTTSDIPHIQKLHNVLAMLGESEKSLSLQQAMEYQQHQVLIAQENQRKDRANAEAEFLKHLTTTDTMQRAEYLALYSEALQGNASEQCKLAKMYADGQGITQSDTQAVKWYRMAAEQGEAKGQNGLGVMYANGRGINQSDTEAVKWYRMAADQGLANAQANLGWMYANGRGINQSDTEAVKWSRLAAQQGDAAAQFNLGVVYANGQGVNQSDTEAVKWYRMAAEQGYVNAQFNLGLMYANGRGVNQSDTEAVKWYRMAAQQGDAFAQCNLGLMYEKGQGVNQSDTEAVKWYRMAAEQGLAVAQRNMGVTYAHGRGVKQNNTEAVKWFRMAAEQGDANAQFNLGVMYAHGQGVKQNNTEAVKWFRMAAQQGFAMAQFSLGVMYENGHGVKQSDREAFVRYRMAAEQGFANAQFNLGVMYDTGRGVTQSDTEAFIWYRLAAQQGDADAQHSLGVMYAYGRGVNQSDTEAVKWYRMAAQQGNANAQNNLSLMYVN